MPNAIYARIISKSRRRLGLHETLNYVANVRNSKTHSTRFMKYRFHKVYITS